MPRSKQNRDEFVAGALPTITYDNKKYFVDGRLKQLRNTEDFMDKLETDDEVWDKLSIADKNVITYEFYGETIN